MNEQKITIIFEDGSSVKTEITNTKYIGHQGVIEISCAWLEDDVQTTTSQSCFP